MKTKKTNESKDFQIEELEQRLEMDGRWGGSDGQAGRTENVDGGTALAVLAILIIIIICL